MRQSRQIPIHEVANFFNDNELATTEKYISENLLLARGVNIAPINNPFLNEPIIFPEMRILMVEKGIANPIINLMPQQFRSHDIIFLGKNSILEIHTPYEVIGNGITMTDELFNLAFGKNIPKSFDGHIRNNSVHLDNEEWEHINNLHLILYNHLQKGGSTMAALNLIAAFFNQADYLFSRQVQFNRSNTTREQQLLTNFIQLVEQQAKHQHNIDYYAQQLCLSPRYMSTIIKRISGKAAKSWIDEALITKIKIELKYTDKPINIIAEEMNFPNPSFFTKFFKRLTGTTPNQYRKPNTTHFQKYPNKPAH